MLRLPDAFECDVARVVEAERVAEGEAADLVRGEDLVRIGSFADALRDRERLIEILELAGCDLAGRESDADTDRVHRLPGAPVREASLDPRRGRDGR